jgi:hypothetical protein
VAGGGGASCTKKTAVNYKMVDEKNVEKKNFQRNIPEGVTIEFYHI